MKLNDSVRSIEWKAAWVHCNLSGSGPHYALFRQELTVETPLSHAVAYITADRHYKLFVDGRLVGEGPLRSNIHYWSYDSYDLTDSLTAGSHSVSVLVSQWNPGPGNPLALLFQCAMTDRKGGNITLLSDRSWRFKISDEWRSDMPPNIWIGPLQNGYVEFRDMRREPVGWMQAGYDDSAWEHAHVFTRYESGQPVNIFGGKWDWLVARDLPCFTGRILKPIILCAAGEIRGGEIYAAKDRYDSQWLSDLENLLPPENGTVINAEELIREGSAATQLNVRYIGRSFGRMLIQPAVILDFGELINGYVRIDVEADADLVVDMTYAQTLQQGRLYPDSGGILRFNRYVLRAGRQQIETCEWHNLRYLQLTVRGDVGKGYASRLTVYSIRLRTIEYPVAVSGSFSCSDPLLTDVWNATLRTTHLCTLDVFMDNTYREKGGWGGDISQMVLSALTCFGRLDVIRRYLDMFIQEQSPSGVIHSGVPGWGGSGMGSGGIFDHAMAIPMRIVQYYEYTDDEVFLRQCYPALRRYMAFVEKYEMNDGTLGEVPGYVWFDWADLDRRLPSVILNFYYCILLKHMEKAATHIDCPGDAAIYRLKAERIRDCASQWWREELSAFPDSIISDRSEPVSEQTNALALLCINDRDRIDAIIRNIFSEGFGIRDDVGIIQSGPPFALYVLEGLCRVGRHDLACEYIRQRHGIAIANGLDTMPESWIYFSNGETSAAQGTLAAAYILTGEVLGIKPYSPGFETVLLEPHPGGLRWACGEIPTPLGVVKMRWNNEGTFSMEAVIPPKAKGMVRLPCMGDKPPRCDTALQIEQAAGKWYVSLPAGNHRIKMDYTIQGEKP